MYAYDVRDISRDKSPFTDHYEEKFYGKNILSKKHLIFVARIVKKYTSGLHALNFTLEKIGIVYSKN